MIQIIVDSAEYRRHQPFPQLLPLAVNIHVAAPREVDALERARLVLFRLHDLACMPFAPLIDQEGFAPVQFLDVPRMNVHHGLDDRTFGGDHHDFLIGIIEGRTDAPRVAHGKHLAAPGQSADDKAAVPRRHAARQHLRQVDSILNSLRNLNTLQALGFAGGVELLHFAVEAVPHLLEHDIGVGIFARMLPHRRNIAEKFVHVCQIEIPAKG